MAARALILTKDKKAIGYLSKIALSDDIEKLTAGNLGNR